MQQLEMFPSVLVDRTIDKSVLNLVLMHLKDTKKRNRYAAFSIETVRKALGHKMGRGYETITLDGINFQICPQKLRGFLNEQSCVQCGKTGNVFLVEKQANCGIRYLCFYSAGVGGLTAFTSDHILPHSLGGKDTVRNLQTMCSSCNQRKANVMTLKELLDVSANISNYAKEWVDHGHLELMLLMQYKLYHEKNKKNINQLYRRYEKSRKLIDPQLQIELYKKKPVDVAVVLGKTKVNSSTVPSIPLLVIVRKKFPFRTAVATLAAIFGLSFPSVSLTESQNGTHSLSCIPNK